MTPISRDELSRLPYVDAIPDDGRVVTMGAPYFDCDAREWHLYLEIERGRLGRIAGGEPIHGAFYARAPEDPDRDYELRLATLLTQQLSFPGVLPNLYAFEHDVHTCAAILEKYHLIAATAAELGYTRVLMTSELEFLLTVIRRAYDRLQAIVRAVVPLFGSLDAPSVPLVKNLLPASFASVTLHGDELLTVDEIVNRRGLPIALAQWYVAEAPAFRLFRKIRNEVEHTGKYLTNLVDLPNHGFAVAQDEEPWIHLSVWDGVPPVNNRLVPLRMAFGGFIWHLLGATERLVETIRSMSSLPPPIGKQVRVYLRSAVSRRLVQIPNMIQVPWERQSAPAPGSQGD